MLAIIVRWGVFSLTLAAWPAMAQIQPCAASGQPVASWICTLPGEAVAQQDFRLRMRPIGSAPYCGTVVRHWQVQSGTDIDLYLAHAGGCLGIPPYGALLDLPTLRLPAGTYRVRRHNWVAHGPVNAFDPSQYTLFAQDTLVVSGTPAPPAVPAPTSSVWALLVMALVLLVAAGARRARRARDA